MKRQCLKKSGVDRRLGSTINGRIQAQIFLLPLFQLAIPLPLANPLHRIPVGTSSQRGVVGLSLLGLRAPRFNIVKFKLIHRRQLEARFVFSVCRRDSRQSLRLKPRPSQRKTIVSVRSGIDIIFQVVMPVLQMGLRRSPSIPGSQLGREQRASGRGRILILAGTQAMLCCIDIVHPLWSPYIALAHLPCTRVAAVMYGISSSRRHHIQGTRTYHNVKVVEWTCVF